MYLPKSDRTRKTERRYQEDKLNNKTQSLLDVPILAKLSPHWYLKYNEYPYDEKWEESLMIVYYTRCEWADLPVEHVLELHHIKCEMKSIYDKILENGKSKSSVLDVPHNHLLRGEK